MNKYSYRLSDLGMPGEKENVVEADRYEFVLNDRSGMYEYIFYIKNAQGVEEVALIIPVYLMDGGVRQVG